MRICSYLKKIYPSIIIVLFLSSFISCGEDRIGEYEAIVTDKLRIEEKMREVYLWYEDMPEKGSINYFLSPSNFFKKLLKNGDSFSDIIELDEETITNTSYGFNVEFIQSTTSTKYFNAYILYVLPDSPAYVAGLKRGERISKINDKQITKAHQDSLYSGQAIKLTIETVSVDNGTYIWEEDRSIIMEAAVKLEETFIIEDTIIKTEKGNIVGYMAYLNFPTVNESEIKSDLHIKELDNTFRKFKEENVTQFVLDLRYAEKNNSLAYVQVLASLLAPKANLGETFCHVKYSDKRSQENYTLELLTSFAENNLNLDRLYIITGTKNAAAFEFIFYGLEPYMEKILKIGQTTKGQYVISEPYTIVGYDNLILYPAVATLYNSKDETYSKGFVPDVTLNETAYINDLYPLGYPQEILFRKVIEIIENNGIIPVEKDDEEEEEGKDENNNNEGEEDATSTKRTPFRTNNKNTRLY